MSRRGSTGVRRPARLPPGRYEPRAAVQATANTLVVDFRGEDGRDLRFAVDTLPLPGWHQALAAAWEARVGTAGSLRTSTSAVGAWAGLKRLIRFLAAAPRPPADPSQLTAEHVDAFGRHRAATVGPVIAGWELRDLGKVFLAAPLCDLVETAALDRLREKRPGQLPPRPGYSDGELSRLLATARGDVAGLRERLHAAEDLLHRRENDPGTLTAAEQDRAGIAEVPAAGTTQTMVLRRQLAEQLFATRRDLVPMLVLLVAVTGQNIETIKELPVDHRIIEDRAVELVVTKRRRGRRNWHSTVTWEIGPPGRELPTPGGLYLLLHRLMHRGRALLDAPTFWAIWHNTGWPGGREQGCRDPFGLRLNNRVCAPGWIERRGLHADPVVDMDTADSTAAGADGGAPLLVLDFNRLKTSVDVRRTRQVGGHLPSAVRTNTMPVLFTNYLRGDPTTIEWAQQVMSEALTDVEHAAWAAHRRALAAAGGTALNVVSGTTSVDALTRAGLGPETAQRAVDGGLDTAWSACSDHDHHPATGRPCRFSFLDCFHCGNCVVIQEHLPPLLSLLDALEARRAHLSEEQWWARYGPTWAAIRYDVLCRFTAEELAAAAAVKPSDALLDLVEPTWEHP
jgi:hypothetical protein